MFKLNPKGDEQKKKGGITMNDSAHRIVETNL